MSEASNISSERDEFLALLASLLEFEASEGKANDDGTAMLRSMAQAIKALGKVVSDEDSELTQRMASAAILVLEKMQPFAYGPNRLMLH